MVHKPQLWTALTCRGNYTKCVVLSFQLARRANWTKPGFCKRRAAAAANCPASSATALRRTSEGRGELLTESLRDGAKVRRVVPHRATARGHGGRAAAPERTTGGSAEASRPQGEGRRRAGGVRACEDGAAVRSLSPLRTVKIGIDKYTSEWYNVDTDG